MKILLVEDDEVFVSALANNLAKQNYTVESVPDGQLGWHYAQAAEYDLILLDVNLPGLDGISLCKRLRQEQYKGAILLLTAEGNSTYKVTGLDAGADDYVVKPCSMGELSARIRALLRRPRELTSPILQWGELELHPSTCQVYFAQKEVTLSPKEYGLLELFLRNPQQVFSNESLLERLWRFDDIPGEETVRTNIKRLRRKLKQAGANQVIRNVYGMGYGLASCPDTAADSQNTHKSFVQSPSTQGEPEAVSGPSDAAAQSEARAAAIAALGKFSGLITSRLQVLKEASVALQAQSLSDELRQQAKQAAHKLTGSLGMFGFIDCSKMSQKIEASLQGDRAALDSETLSKQVGYLQQTLAPALQVSNVTTEEAPQTHRLTTQNTQNTETGVSEPSLLVISANVKLIEELTELAQGQIHLHQTKDLTQARQLLSQETHHTVLLDMAMLPTWQAMLPWLAEFTEMSANLLVLLHQDTFPIRLEIARCCNSLLLSPGISAQEIVDNVLEQHQRRALSNFRILVLDDDPVILNVLGQHLASWGMLGTTLNDPCLLWDSLSRFNPDLLLLDVEMPDINGIELCKVIRSDRVWSQLPIVFLTTCRDSETVQAIYQAGADDYITKPFVAQELATRIVNRLVRSHLK